LILNTLIERASPAILALENPSALCPEDFPKSANVTHLPLTGGGVVWKDEKRARENIFHSWRIGLKKWQLLVPTA
jgi:hypothetical protein